jgi:hypothetical protein
MSKRSKRHGAPFAENERGESRRHIRRFVRSSKRAWLESGWR